MSATTPGQNTADERENSEREDFASPDPTKTDEQRRAVVERARKRLRENIEVFEKLAET
jgi:hypothetical protein